MLDTEEMSSTYYRYDDPLENFKLRVVVREVLRNSIRENREIRENDNEATVNEIQGFYFEQTIAWQEKVYSPMEISDYMHNRDNSKGTVSQHESRRHLGHLERRGVNIESLLRRNMVYTMVDKDYHPGTEANPILTNFDPSLEPYLGAAVHNAHSGDPLLDRRSKEIGDKIRNDRPSKTMHICLATDVDVDEILDRHVCSALFNIFEY